MDDLISRTAAIAQIKENYCDWCDHTDLCKSCETRDCIATIEQQVTAVDAAPVVHGQWGEKQDCSVCGFQPWYEGDIHTLSYCPNCGAKMKGDATHEPSTGD